MYDWEVVITHHAKHTALVNGTRPGGKSCYTVLHQAAHGSAPVAVVKKLITLGAWRTLRTSQGERAVDIAERKGHTQFVSLLTPVLQREVAPDVLQAIQDHFHAVIRERMSEFNITTELRLPELEPLLELKHPTMWFPVSGMYSGFSYEVRTAADAPALISENESRMADGSGQRHLVSTHGSLLLDEGFI